MIAIVIIVLSPDRSSFIAYIDPKGSAAIQLFSKSGKSSFIKRSRSIYNYTVQIRFKITGSTRCSGHAQSYPHIMVPLDNLR